MENKFLTIDNKDEWRQLLDKVFFRTFFHLLEWESFLEKEFKWLKFERYVWPTQGGQALLSLARVKIGGKEKLISHPFCEYGGPLPLVREIDGQQFSQDVLEHFKDTPLKISFHPMLLSYFAGMNFPENQRETYLIEDIDKLKVDELGYQSGQGMDRNRRRLIKRGREYFGEAEDCGSVADLKQLYDLYVKTLKKHKVPVYPFSFFEFFYNHAKEVDILLAKDKRSKKVLGGIVFLLQDKIIHSFLAGLPGQAGLVKEHKKFGAHDFLIWSELKRNQEREKPLGILDFGGARKTSSVSEFKRRWGGRSYPIYELKNYIEEPGMKKSFLRNMWGYLPAALTKRLSPYFLKYKL